MLIWIRLFSGGLLLREVKIPTDEPMLKEKAIDIAKALIKPAFKASDGWLINWKER